MFGSGKTYLDLSYDLRDKRDWRIAVIRELDFLAQPHALAIEPASGLLAVGQWTEIGFVPNHTLTEVV
jgi:syntaxin-binding protein 5